MRIALARGKAAFGDNCAGCHGMGGAGGVDTPISPMMTGSGAANFPTSRRRSCTVPAWSHDNRTRSGEMLAFGKTSVLKRGEIETVVEYVRSLAGLDVEKGANLARARNSSRPIAPPAMAKMPRATGAWRTGLTDAIWLYGSSRTVLTQTITNGRAGIMPAWEGRLDPVTIKALTLYVHSLGGGQ